MSAQPPSPRLGYLFKLAHLQFGELVGAALAPLGIDNREWAVLISLDEERALSQMEVANLVGVDRTTMVSLVDELQKKKLVERRPHDADRRKNVVAITAAGRAIRKRAARTVDTVERKFLAKLEEAEAERLKAALCTLVAPAANSRPERT